ncbi:MAG: glycosyltransferase family 4 protein [Anaerolineae bacterium]
MHLLIDYTPAVRQAAGIGRLTRHLVRAAVPLLAEHDITLFVAGPMPAAHPEREGWPANVRIVDTRLSERALTILWHRAGLPLPAEIWAGRGDLFHATDFVLPPTLAPGIVTVHDLSFLRFPECAHPNLRRYLMGAVPRSLKRAARILADSQAAREDLVQLLGVPAEKIAVVYGGVEERFSPAPEPALDAELVERYELRAPYILSLGTLEPRKNYVRLLRAYERAWEEAGGDFPVLVIAGGKGWLYEEIFEAHRSLRARDHVRFLGFVEDRVLPALYRRAWLFVYPSLYEGFGLPPLEAMACGCPVACSNSSSLPEVVGDAALTFDPLDEVALAGVLRRGVEDSELRERLRAAGLARASQFTWAKAAEALLVQYRQVMHG